eukprot:CAMPEP_0172541766 /NCGR_PEP_ID=MMETSP1067-20121228/12536_1 /TAXON_ID=265564 ORGANISM="Thalassiosira punctigera, Strain Tpunct2005C2" /NCGR_SAMPLE_ID=MMETSP1067 /ASSEMBLY_ACC=CAM_ASM_000444 /LENGTH=384 /DNA_ID=CAMNT_0013327879 /DNA_START=121 /DNA_END=1272 /DNA_ORIENTATION=+
MDTPTSSFRVMDSDSLAATPKAAERDAGICWASQSWDWGERRARKRKKYTWEDLNTLERKRRDILRRLELPFSRILTYYDGTCLMAFMKDWLGWLTVGIYVFVRMQVRLPWVPFRVYDFGDSDIGIIGGFLSFFLVLFVNQANGRMNEQYKCSMDCQRCMYDVAGIVDSLLPKSDAARIVRYMNAAHVAGYAGLSSTYSKANFFDELDSRLGLLTPNERDRVESLDMDSGGDCFREIVMWAMRLVTRAQDTGHVDARTAGTLRDKLLKFRDSMDSLYDYADQPVPFYYIHFLSVLSTLYLPLFAVSLGYSAGMGDGMGGGLHWTADVISGLIVLVQSIFVIGLRLLGQQMIDPYGDDEEDLSVLTYVREGWETSNRILASRLPD